jgi:hypothetical protein
LKVKTCLYIFRFVTWVSREYHVYRWFWLDDIRNLHILHHPSDELQVEILIVLSSLLFKCYQNIKYIPLWWLALDSFLCGSLINSIK